METRGGEGYWMLKIKVTCQHFRVLSALSWSVGILLLIVSILLRPIF